MENALAPRIAPSARPAPANALAGLYFDPRYSEVASNPTPQFDPTMRGARDYAMDPRSVGNQIVVNMATSAAPVDVRGGARAVQGVRAYHGSPHRFDRFDMSRIGTGEGAQAYGHGLYFAQSEDVARSYRDAMNPANRASQNVEQFLIARAGTRVTPDEVIRLFQQDDALRPMATPEVAEAVSRTTPGYTSLGELSGETVSGLSALDTAIQRAAGRGSMYEVNLRVDPNRLLDWDAPLSQQPQAVREALGAAARARAATDPKVARLPTTRALAAGEYRADGSPILGGEAYEAAGGWSGPFGAMTPGNAGPAQMSQRLREAGIPGIRYLDGGSRAAGEGSRNYVIFDDNLIEILRRYGLLGMLGGGAAAASGGEAEAAQ